MADKQLTPLDLPELSSAPASPGSGFHRFYAKTDGKAYSKNSAGTEYDLTATGGSSVVTFNRQAASYTLALSDANKMVEMNVATANNLTVPLNSSVLFPTGTIIDVVQYGAGQTTIVATGGVTLRSTNNWLKINARYGAVTLVKVGTDEWYVFGNLNA
jgi:hypothetical protein